MLVPVIRFLFFTCFLLGFGSIPCTIKKWTFGFKLAKMELHLPNHPQWDVPFDPTILSLLQQKFCFLGRGAQCYVFESKDQKYVIKLFRYDKNRKIEKIEALFRACMLAYHDLKEETGLIYIHLNQTQDLLPTIQCIGPLGRTFSLPLDRYQFAIQRKAQNLFEVFLKAKDDPRLLQERFDQFMALLQARVDKKVVNYDTNLSRNFGFLEDRAIEFDFGNFSYHAEMDPTLEMNRFTSKLQSWLMQNGLQ